MLKNKNLRLVTLNDDPREQVIWNQDRPIAYLNRGDSTLDEFIEPENLIQASPKMNDALWAIANHIPENWGDECKDGYVRLNISADAIDAVEGAIHPDVSATSAVRPKERFSTETPNPTRKNTFRKTKEDAARGN